jgi:hypothetical protein
MVVDSILKFPSFLINSSNSLLICHMLTIWLNTIREKYMANINDLGDKLLMYFRNG